MAATALALPRFVRRTQLGSNEYRRNFHQIDREVIAAVTSEEADGVTPLMSKVYLRLTSSPAEFWEREGVLRFAGGEQDGRWVTAWAQLVARVGVASATARKALQWMHEQGIVGYFAGKNGVGIRIFLNRAASSIGQRPDPDQKNLRVVRASTEAPHASSADTPFNDSFADLESLEIDVNPRAPESGAEQTKVVSANRRLPPIDLYYVGVPKDPEEDRKEHLEFLFNSMLARAGQALKNSLNASTSEAIAREHERTREWLENRGLPKVARVAQREAYNVLRQHGVIKEGAGNFSTQAVVGHNLYQPEAPRALSYEEIEELAQACVALLETKGQSIDVTLSEMSVAAGGFLLAEDAPRVREKANALAGGTACVEQADSQRAGCDLDNSLKP
jgi:hypothetical protein